MVCARGVCAAVASIINCVDGLSNVGSSLPLLELFTSRYQPSRRSAKAKDSKRMLKYVPQNWPWQPGLAKFQPATEIDQLQLTFFVLKIESGYNLLCNMIEIHTYYLLFTVVLLCGVS